MFAVIYNGHIIREFKDRNLAFRFLIREGWEWDDKATIRRLP